MSVDSFALPTVWWALAILWTMSRLKREEQFNSFTKKNPGKVRRRIERVSIIMGLALSLPARTNTIGELLRDLADQSFLSPSKS
jgi:hypothetical protein